MKDARCKEAEARETGAGAGAGALAAERLAICSRAPASWTLVTAALTSAFAFDRLGMGMGAGGRDGDSNLCDAPAPAPAVAVAVALAVAVTVAVTVALAVAVAAKVAVSEAAASGRMGFATRRRTRHPSTSECIMCSAYERLQCSSDTSFTESRRSPGVSLPSVAARPRGTSERTTSTEPNGFSGSYKHVVQYKVRATV